MGGFLWFSFLLLVAFYVINLLFLDAGIKQLIRSTSIYKISNTDVDTNSFSDEQKQWMKDISRCPACGEHLQVFDNTCPECGLRLPHPTMYKPLDISKYKEKNKIQTKQ